MCCNGELDYKHYLAWGHGCINQKIGQECDDETQCSSGRCAGGVCKAKVSADGRVLCFARPWTDVFDRATIAGGRG